MKNLFILLLFAAIACKTNKSAVDYSAQGFVKAKVIKYEVESCGYLIQLSDEKKLMPQNLSDEFKRDNLEVWIKYEALKKQPMSTCMAGQAVRIVEIKKQ